MSLRNTVRIAILLCQTALCNLGALPPPLADISDPVTPGQWHPDLGAAITYAEQNDIPLLYIWGVQGCDQSNKLDDYLNNTAFQQWAGGRRLVMAYIKAPDTRTTDAKDFAKYGLNGTLTDYPMAAVYWPSKNSAPYNFSARYPVASNTVGAEQLIAEIEFFIAAYVTPISYSEWTAAENIPENLRGYTDTPAGDAIPNLIKYASGLPALTPSTTADLLSIAEEPAPDSFAIIYYISRSATEVTLEPVRAGDLTGPWLTTGITLQYIGEESGREVWKASIILGDQGFMRLRATAD